MYPYAPQNEDELELSPGDFIYMSSLEQNNTSEGWVFGTSHSTGVSGLLPENYISRADECDTWVFHGSVPRGTSHDPPSGALPAELSGIGGPACCTYAVQSAQCVKACCCVSQRGKPLCL